MKNFDELVEIVKRLRSEDGCPWDKEQTLNSLRGHILEEAYELVDAIDNNDVDNIKEEAGDLLLQVLFIANISEEKELFNLKNIIGSLIFKLIERHPHVFGNENASTPEEAKKIWDNQKNINKKVYNYDEIESSSKRALKVSSSYAKKGLEFKSKQELINKLKEEIEEYETALVKGSINDIENEVGDILFTCMNICRFERLNPDIALNSSTKKFIKRANKFLDIKKSENINDDEAWNKAKLDTK